MHFLHHSLDFCHRKARFFRIPLLCCFRGISMQAKSHLQITPIYSLIYSLICGNKMELYPLLCAVLSSILFPQNELLPCLASLHIPVQAKPAWLPYVGIDLLDPLFSSRTPLELGHHTGDSLIT